MKMNDRKLLLAASLLACASVAAAQQARPQTAPATAPARPTQPAQQAPALTPEQRAALAKQDAEITRAATQVLQLVDTNRIGEVWDGASPTMKKLVSRDEFIKQITIDRNKLGASGARSKAVVSRSQFAAGGQVPAGLYINVSFQTKFAKAPQPVRELVSFRLDEDKTWRVSGYSLR
jgi:glucose/arabinose dehydrogenase